MYSPYSEDDQEQSRPQQGVAAAGVAATSGQARDQVLGIALTRLAEARLPLSQAKEGSLQALLA